jgi:hypothetical protein
MHAAFPELTVVRGHVWTLDRGRAAHWWLETADGAIVDPTASQFAALCDYEPWVPGTEVRVGRCMECGAEIMEALLSLDIDVSKCICSPECAKAFETAINGHAAGLSRAK